jgi:general secretion pathway protein B
MSLLMDALKLQQQKGQPQQDGTPVIGMAPTVVAPSQRGWQVLALLLLMVVGILTGFLVADWWQQRQQLQQPIAAPVVPATPAQIVSDILAVKAPVVVEEVEPEAPQLVVSALPGGGKQAKTRAVDAAETTAVADDWEAQAEADAFVAETEMAMADPAEEVQELLPQQPELTAAEVPDELKRKFELALAQTDQVPAHQRIKESAAPARDIHSLDELLKRQIPPLRFEAHVYASTPEQRWVKVNGKDLQEGQWVTADIQIKEITSQYVLMQMGRQLFSMEALTEWSYRLPPG